MSSLAINVLVEVPESIHRDIICILIGTTANWILFGTLCVQVYLYYNAFPKDRLPLRSIVFVQFLLQTVQTVMLTHDVIQPFAITFTNPNPLNEVGTLWFSIIFVIGLIASINQGFYCYRIGVLTRSKCAVALIIMLSLSQLVAAIFVTVQGKRAVLLTTLLAQKSSLTAIGVWGICSLTCDIAIAVIMTYHLRKRDTGFANTHSIIVRLVRLSIETGCVTAFSAGALLTLAYLPQHPPYYVAVSSIVAKTYSSSMMTVLNSRIKLVSNASGSAAPIWNESVKPIALFDSTGTPQGIVFRRDSEAGYSASRIASHAP